MNTLNVTDCVCLRKYPDYSGKVVCVGNKKMIQYTGPNINDHRQKITYTGEQFSSLKAFYERFMHIENTKQLKKPVSKTIIGNIIINEWQRYGYCVHNCVPAQCINNICKNSCKTNVCVHNCKNKHVCKKCNPTHLRGYKKTIKTVPKKAPEKVSKKAPEKVFGHLSVEEQWNLIMPFIKEAFMHNVKTTNTNDLSKVCASPSEFYVLNDLKHKGFNVTIANDSLKCKTRKDIDIIKHDGSIVKVQVKGRADKHWGIMTGKKPYDVSDFDLLAYLHYEKMGDLSSAKLWYFPAEALIATDTTMKTKVPSETLKKYCNKEAQENLMRTYF